MKQDESFGLFRESKSGGLKEGVKEGEEGEIREEFLEMKSDRIVDMEKNEGLTYAQILRGDLEVGSATFLDGFKKKGDNIKFDKIHDLYFGNFTNKIIFGEILAKINSITRKWLLQDSDLDERYKYIVSEENVDGLMVIYDISEEEMINIKQKLKENCFGDTKICLIGKTFVIWSNAISAKNKFWYELTQSKFILKEARIVSICILGTVLTEKEILQWSEDMKGIYCSHIIDEHGNTIINFKMFPKVIYYLKDNSMEWNKKVLRVVVKCIDHCSLCGLKGHKLKNCCFEKDEIKAIQGEILQLNPDMIERSCRKSLLDEKKWKCKFCLRPNMETIDCCSFCWIKKDGSNSWECFCKAPNSESKGSCWRCKKGKNDRGDRGWWCIGCKFYNYKERRVCYRCKVDPGEEGRIRVKKYREVVRENLNSEETVLVIDDKEDREEEKEENKNVVEKIALVEHNVNIKILNKSEEEINRQNKIEEILTFIPEDLREVLKTNEIVIYNKKVKLSSKMMGFKMEKENKEERRILEVFYKILKSKITIVNEGAFKAMISGIEKKKARQIDGAIATCCRNKDITKWGIRRYIRVEQARVSVDPDFVKRVLQEDFNKEEIRRIGTLVGRVSEDTELVEQVKGRLDEVGIEFHLRAPSFSLEEDKVIRTFLGKRISENNWTKVLHEKSDVFGWFRTEGALRTRAKNMNNTKSGQISLRGLVNVSDKNDGRI
jgi:hypothetical protein